MLICHRLAIAPCIYYTYSHNKAYKYIRYRYFPGIFSSLYEMCSMFISNTQTSYALYNVHIVSTMHLLLAYELVIYIIHGNIYIRYNVYVYCIIWFYIKRYTCAHSWFDFLGPIFSNLAAVDSIFAGSRFSEYIGRYANHYGGREPRVFHIFLCIS